LHRDKSRGRTFALFSEVRYGVCFGNIAIWIYVCLRLRTVAFVLKLKSGNDSESWDRGYIKVSILT